MLRFEPGAICLPNKLRVPLHWTPMIGESTQCRVYSYWKLLFSNVFQISPIAYQNVLRWLVR